MREHMEAVKALLEATGRQVYVGEVPEAPTFPYHLLWSSAGREVSDDLGDCVDYLEDTIYVTTAGITAESVMSVTASARAVLNRVVPAVTGWHPEPLRLEPNLSPIQQDRDVTIPGTKRHPQFGVDGYRVVSQRI